MYMKSFLKFVIYLFAAFNFSAVNAGAYEDFFRAVGVDDAGTVGALLARGFDPNAPDEQGQVGLFLALRVGSPKVAEALLAHPGIRIDAANRHGETPLMMAALQGRIEWVRRLLERGAAVNREGWTPLHYAASGEQPSGPEIIALLLDRGARIDAPSPNRSTPLMLAARYGIEGNSLTLLARGANPRLRNDQDLNAADFARRGGRESLAARLDAAAR
jgi:ankyrin repeat protein